ncbi:50S ribosomal protein L4 [Reichenbachiella ulvae]|uniref:Large ribosomal subunit protein uL4 n=1 Tax=Reichenbachiella ulvae TaxID=2980104 RepID=A0ABT3D0L5_9BACT|nr:50S ribosomal protein L4 [Reichenbachiella ulvae]MCV9388993.1 50S ribosomal protein L4 [Reichenbachiella ulvae]
MKVSVLTKTGEDTGRKVDLSKDVFGIEPNDHAIYLDVKQYLANQRQGTHKSKERAEIAGSTKKIKKQKGTGTARAGSIKSPVFRGGGRVFGPKPRNYDIDLNKKLKVLARKSALSYKATEKSISVLEDFSFDAPKTKDYAALLNSLSFADKKTLLVLKEDDKNVLLSSKNLKKAQVVVADQINTYDLLKADNLILLEGSIEKIQNLLTK